MQINLETKSASQWSGDLLALPFFDKKPFSHPATRSINSKLEGICKKILQRSGYKGEKGQNRLIPTFGKLHFDYVLVVGLGDLKKLTLEDLRRAAAQVAKEADSQKGKRILSLLSLVNPPKQGHEAVAQVLTEGTCLALHRFDKFKGKKGEKSKLQRVSFVVSGEKSQREFRRGIQLGQWGSEGTLLARDLVNTPSRDKPPEYLGRISKGLKGIRTRVFDHRKIKRMGMGALYGVGMGSSYPPVFIEMHYKPRGRIKKRVALVGKGITFDSGGLSLKPPNSMETMKDDMAGAAAVIGAMKMLPKFKPSVEVWGYVASAENMPDGKAQRPGDVVKAYNGKTIEVLNTDAEGRLALADALSYVTKHRKVDYIIDIATLTGAALVALGDMITAALGTDDELLKQLREAGEFTGEKIWELPLELSYMDEMKSGTADIKNIGGRYGGTINGALFLKNFVDEKAKWVHLDIAGPSWANKAWDYCPVGGTGLMVRTFLKFLSDL
jgi:leucyl aminopeptidase